MEALFFFFCLLTFGVQLKAFVLRQAPSWIFDGYASWYNQQFKMMVFGVLYLGNKRRGTVFCSIACFECMGRIVFFGDECQTEVVICLIMLQGPTFVLLDSFVESFCLLAPGVPSIQQEYEHCYILCCLRDWWFCLIAL